MSRVLCLLLPNLSTDRVRHSGVPPQDDGTPLVLTRRSGGAVLVEQVCPAARRLGVRAGQTLAQARALAPGLHDEPADPAQDDVVLRRLADWAIRFSPVLEVREPDAILIDVAGCAALFGDELNIARRAVGGLMRQGFAARAALADTVGAAYAVALAAPGPITIVPPGQASAYLAPLPPEALRLDSRTAARLASLGVRTIGDLLMLPRASLPARFGPQIVLRLEQALGELHEGVGTHSPPLVCQAGLRFESPLSDWIAIRSIAERLLNDVLQQVVAHGLAVRELDCVLFAERGQKRIVPVRLARPSRRGMHLCGLLLAALERCDWRAGLHALRIVARDVSPWRPGQAELFEERPAAEDEELAGLVDRLAGQLGHGAVVRIELIDDHQPELAYRYVPVADAGLVTSEAQRGPLQPREPRRSRDSADGRNDAQVLGFFRRAAARPIRLLRSPAPIRVLAVAPDGPVTWLGWQGREYVIVRCVGPERIETAWWRGADVRRDYFRVTTNRGEQYWIYCDLSGRRWFLHGIFA